MKKTGILIVCFLLMFFIGKVIVMRKKIVFSVLFLLFAFMINNQYTVLAMDTGFETEGIDSDTQAHIFMKMEIELLESDMEDFMISHFDVNENNGNIALCFEDSGRKKIGIYDPDGKFKYGYSFLESGSIGVEWDGNNIIIYSVRGDRAILIDKDAHLIDMKRIIINSQNNTYWHDVVFSNEKQFGDEVYTLHNSKLVKKEINGKETVVIDRSTKKSIWNMSVVFYFVILFTFFIVWLIRYCMKNNRASRSVF